ncbi:Bestrophin, RFP-TM, chloride channel-domain-containing protein [Cyathus striatus]|nr:Bestrophin, RFP-TM, chloride channel-domain-containing protein [Cyathus striatus]
MATIDFDDYLDDGTYIEPTFDASFPTQPLHSAEIHKGFIGTEPFAAREPKKRSFLDSVVSTAFFKCWHILIVFTVWATIVTALNAQGKKFQLPSTMLTVIGTVLGFVTSTRANTSFERYNSGRALWSRLIFHSRVFARILWFNVPEMAATEGETIEELRAKDLIEKKTVLNLILAHAVALKHYLRHEDGIYYKDLYYLVKFLPAYVERQSVPSPSAQAGDKVFEDITHKIDPYPPYRNREAAGLHSQSSITHPVYPVHLAHNIPLHIDHQRTVHPALERHISAILSKQDEAFLLPAKKPPKYHLLDLFPFSLLVQFLSQKYKDRQSKRARMKELLRRKRVNHNLPLEISMYIANMRKGSYITLIQKRKITDNLSINTMNTHLNQMVEAATNLERILTTPLPFIYGIHMWLIALIYCFLLPLQIYKPMGWLTIPATSLMTFVYFGFLVAGEELEDPFGYDKNDLDLDHFTNDVMRNELKAITSAPPPDPNRWIFVPENNVLFSTNVEERITPNEWANMGPEKIQNSLRMMR